MIGQTISHYKVLERIGGGGMGVVYRAEDTKLHRQVALKFLPHELTEDRTALERFQREAQAASALNHPNICTIYDLDEHEGQPFIVMELIRGQKEKLLRGPLKTDEVLELGIQLADALDTAHGEGIVHRDIKPANIFVTERGQAKILDFGLAKAARKKAVSESETETRSGSDLDLTKAGSTVGTVPYMSPEQVLGRKVDPRSDIFSTGTVLHEMATGQRPFRGTTLGELIHQITSESHMSISVQNSQLPESLGEVVDKCLAKDPEARYQSARQLAADLEALEKATTPIHAGGVSGRLKHNLPVQLTSFVGRAKEMAEVKQRLESTRLLTLTGAGGCGKTRLALEVALTQLDTFEHGVWFVDLAPLFDATLIPQTVASVFGLQEQLERSIAVALEDYFREKSLLLILDNCEHLLEECAKFAETCLKQAAGLRILATSREALSIGGEIAWRLPSLSLPTAEQVTSGQLLDSDAVQLFVDRARTASDRFSATKNNAKTIARLCERLNGIPLALELAAARLNVLPIEQINKRLADRFRLLRKGSRTALPRQQTLKATMDWSYELLLENEQVLFRRLSVFVGGFTLEAAEAVCNAESDLEIDVLDGVASLVDKSLMRQEEVKGESRLVMLETIREYGLERLGECGEEEDIRRHHANFFLELAEKAEPEIHGADQVEWLDRLEVEHDNLREVLTWSQTGEGSVEVGLRLAVAIGWFWFVRGHLREGGEWLEG